MTRPVPSSPQDSAASDSAALDSGASWVQAITALISMFTVFGIAYSFGAFFESITKEFGSGSGATAFVFSVTISLSFALAPLTGALADRVGPAAVLRIGAGALASGLLITTLVPNIVLGYISYGVGVGVAVACGYVPMVATVGGWFAAKRTLAVGVAVAGIGLGTLVGSPVTAALLRATSWRTAFVIYAVVGAGLLLGCSLVAKPGPAAVPAPKLRPIGELMRVRDFRLLYVASVCLALGLFVPFVFLATYAKDGGAGDVAAATLVGLIGGSSIVGRLGLGALAERVGVIRLYQFSMLIMALSHLVWLLAGDQYLLLVLYAVILGFGYGGFIAIGPAVVAEKFGLVGIGGVLGTLYTSAAIGALVGPPLAGTVIDASGYTAAIVGAAAISAVGWVVQTRVS